MKKYFILTALPVFYSFIINAQKLPATLLWRISGNGLEKPSYLYGTIHLTDDRVFNLGDSLFKAIETSDGFAMEVRPEDFTPFIVDEAKKSILEARRVKDMMESKSFEKYSKVLAKKLNKDEDEITAGDIINEKNKWMTESYRTGKMQTFLDVYLYDIARRQGKWLGGVEDFKDQEDLINYAFDATDIEAIAEEPDVAQKGKNSPIEQLINVYIKNDLDAILAISSANGDSLYHDKLLTKRNIKMAGRMDSLSHLRSMVFAVGAAHLPGDEGLISLLKEKGYTLTPVFASKKIKPANYKVKDVPQVWLDVKDENGFYTASMPGQPGDINMFGVLNMKFYFDVFKSTVYMVTAMNTPYSQNVADSLLSNVSNYYFNVKDYKKGKLVTINNVQVREFSSNKDKYTRGYLAFNDGVMYMAIGTAIKKDSSSENAVARFLKSFAILPQNKKGSDRTYITHTDKTKAFSVEVPAKAVSANESLPQTEDHSIKSDIKIAIDPQTGAYLFFGVNQAEPGYFIENDSITLAQIKESQQSKLSSFMIDTMYIHNGRRIMEYGGMMTDAPLMMKGRYEFRGNRWYALLAIYDTTRDASAINHFFHSLNLLPYEQMQWKLQENEGSNFTTWAPDTFIKDSVTGENEYISFTSFDSTRADNYLVMVEGFGKHYWQLNDSILLNQLADNTLRKYADTILSRKNILNGNIKGIELMSQEKGASIVKRKRLLLNDSKLYILTTTQMADEISNENTNKFFNDFRFVKELPNTELFTSKAASLLKDLANSDSATHDEALEYIEAAPFSKDEMPMLYEALQHTYIDDTAEYRSTKEIIAKTIIGLKDRSAFDFARAHYLTSGEKDKMHLLDIMLSFPTSAHFNDIKDLLLQSPPSMKPDYTVAYDFTDSLELAAEIFPAMLPLLKNENMAPVIISIADNLLDSGIITPALLQPYEKEIVAMAAKNFEKVMENTDNFEYTNYKLLSTLGRINSVNTNAALQQWATIKKIPYTALEATALLLRNKQTVSPAVFTTIAANNETRTDLYDTLTAYGKQQLFPKAYLTQKQFAESYAFVAGTEDGNPDGITYITQKVVDFKGNKARFYFYKLTYGTDEYKSYSLACAGPFDPAGTAVKGSNKPTGSVYYEEDFDGSNLNAQIEAIVKGMEEWYETDGDLKR